jgi:hypothetical protein
MEVLSFREITFLTAATGRKLDDEELVQYILTGLGEDCLCKG